MTRRCAPSHFLSHVDRKKVRDSNFFVRITFQILFHPPYWGAFHLSLTVLSAIDLCTYLALDGGPPSFRPDYTCPTLLRNLPTLLHISSTGLSPAMAARSRDVQLYEDGRYWKSYNPQHLFDVNESR